MAFVLILNEMKTDFYAKFWLREYECLCYAMIAHHWNEVNNIQWSNL